MKNKKTFIGEVVIRCHKKPDKMPDFGLGKGVLSRQEIDFTDENERGFKSPLFVMALIEHEDRLIKEVVEVRWTEKKRKKA